MEETAHGPVHATIAGLVTRLAGSGAGSQVTVDDGTGTLEVWCPAAVTTFGPVISRRFEFDIVLIWDARSEEVAASWAAMQGDDADEDAAIAARFHGSLGPTAEAAVAEAVRPSDDEEG